MTPACTVSPEPVRAWSYSMGRRSSWIAMSAACCCASFTADDTDGALCLPISQPSAIPTNSAITVAIAALRRRREIGM